MDQKYVFKILNLLCMLLLSVTFMLAKGSLGSADHSRAEDGIVQKKGGVPPKGKGNPVLPAKGKGGGIGSSESAINNYLDLVERFDEVVISEAGLARSQLEAYAQFKGITSGKLTQEELKYFVANSFKTDKSILDDPIKAEALNLSIKDLASKRFQRFDTNGNGMLESSEMLPVLRKTFQKYDIDGDGMLNLEEYTQYVRLMLPSLAGDDYLRAVHSDELIRNGDFEQGNTGFESKFEFNVAHILWPLTYQVVKNARDAHRDAPPFGDHSSGNGNMLIFNGNTSKAVNAIVWSQKVDVQPESDYVVSFWLATWFAMAGAELEVRVNEKSVAKVTAPNKKGEWIEFKAKWNSAKQKSATIAIVNLKPSALAIDDISLKGPAATVQLKSETAKNALANYKKEVQNLGVEFAKKLDELRVQYIKELDRARKDALEKEDLDEAQRLLEEKIRVQKDTSQLKAVSGFELLYVKFGVNDKWHDATKEFQPFVKAGSLRVNPSKDKINWSFPDPAFGVNKVVIVVYSVDGRVSVSVTRDDQDIALPAAK